jgi:hypothetical protein
MRKLLRKDVALSIEDKMLRLSEYNYFFNTNYSLEDVYGTDVVENADKEKLVRLENQQILYVDIEECLPNDEYKKAALTFIVNFLYNDFSEFEKMLNDDVSMVIFKQKSIIGKQAVMDYWKDYRYRIRKEIVSRFEVKFCAYYSATGLYLNIRGYTPVCLLYRIDNGKIKNLVYYFPYDEANHEPDEIVDSLPYTCEEASKHYVYDAVPEANRLPCFHCGRPSEQLEWHWAKYYENPDTILKRISVCPECHCVVETKTEKRYERGMDLEEIQTKETAEIECNEITNEETAMVDETNEFARKGNEFRNELEKIAEGNDENKNALFTLLPEVRLWIGYQVRFGKKDVDDADSFLYFYVFDPESNMEKQVSKYVDVKPTPMGIWQYYLLSNCEAFIEFNTQRPWVRPFRYVFDKHDLEKLTELKKRDIRRLEQCGLLFPMVCIKDMEDGSGKHIGEVQCTFWRSDALWRDYKQYVISKEGKVESENYLFAQLLLHRNPGPEIY